MAILFFDTETTGLPDYRADIAAAHQPHIVQLAALLTEDDGTERACFNVIVQVPDSVVVPVGAANVHGITTEVSRRFEIPIRVALNLFGHLAHRMATTGRLYVAHNAQFDTWLIDCACARHDLPWQFFQGEEVRCTMEDTTHILNLPPTDRMVAAGFNKPKPPKLEEAYRHFFGKDLDGAHDALVDVRACRDVFFAVRALGGGNG